MEKDREIAKVILSVMEKNKTEHVFRIYQKVNDKMPVVYREFLRVFQKLHSDGFIIEEKPHYFRKL